MEQQASDTQANTLLCDLGRWVFWTSLLLKRSCGETETPGFFPQRDFIPSLSLSLSLVETSTQAVQQAVQPIAKRDGGEKTRYATGIKLQVGRSEPDYS